MTARARHAFAQMTEISQSWARHAVVPGSVAQLSTSYLLPAAPTGGIMTAMGWIGTGALATFLAVTYKLGGVFSSLQGIGQTLATTLRQLRTLAISQNQAFPDSRRL
ncbi:hypothetical protein BOSE62_50225 [Bosea sp. 62]|uniref:hypothetical protein n=1 Tax=unclassified Bosea (in: a-proteobacteria) TaxID=2653178 RepID=UPI00125A4A36|nr:MULTISPECIES: hypothetical protein [unclassified Bosea (in: a-proteobacteria)]CAD5252248.1 hypothetical protein BOSE46_100021 [Bosea sp. 46]CAD5256927.1 hypothetical protein BOSE21B_110021 [Bosea sp. 21B]CAD5284146.1 hypothetical protein BOSE7B_41195 [Bosea sp. 7B]VVT56415.1 hypothetical protein BOS5A_150014 [Bosea sp. EC-HK365B]VXB33896.1 hypothetical protein BOSE29B_100134 [Bosea sp. 29B]